MEVLVFDYDGAPYRVLHGVTSIHWGGCSRIVQFHFMDGTVEDFPPGYSFQF